MTTTHFGQADVQARIRREIRRIGVDTETDAFSISSPFSVEEFLAALASVPDGAGAVALQAALGARLRLLRSGISDPPLLDDTR